MEKLKLVKYVSTKINADGTEIVRIKKATNALANDVARQAGISKVEAIAKLVEFAYENIEWVEEVD